MLFTLGSRSNARFVDAHGGLGCNAVPGPAVRPDFALVPPRHTNSSRCGAECKGVR